MFTKTNITIPSGEYSSLRGRHISTYGNIRYFELIDYYKVIPLSLLKTMPDRITWTEVTPKADLPHKDYGVATNLNIYINPAEATTTFYSVKPGAKPWTPDITKFYPNIYNHEDLEFYNSFKAKAGEAYLLDVTQVHEVSGMVGDCRQIIQLSWLRKPYHELLSQFNRLGA